MPAPASKRGCLSLSLSLARATLGSLSLAASVSLWCLFSPCGRAKNRILGVLKYLLCRIQLIVADTSPSRLAACFSGAGTAQQHRAVHHQEIEHWKGRARSCRALKQKDRAQLRTGDDLSGGHCSQLPAVRLYGNTAVLIAILVRLCHVKKASPLSPAPTGRRRVPPGTVQALTSRCCHAPLGRTSPSVR